jgi:hypothetical protein
MVQTIKLKGNDYATVPQRLKEFREKNPRATIETKPTVTGEVIMFEAKIIADSSDPNSPSATGHSYGKLTGEKAFEKQETVSVGRALSLLGYLNNGQVASTEEMQEFEEYKLNQVHESIANASNREDFKKILAELTPELKKEVTPLINERIKELANGKTN